MFRYLALVLLFLPSIAFAGLCTVIDVERNKETRIPFTIYNVNTVQPVADAASLACTFKEVVNGSNPTGAGSSCTNTPAQTAAGSGIYYITIAASEIDSDRTLVQITTTTSNAEHPCFTLNTNSVASTRDVYQVLRLLESRQYGVSPAPSGNTRKFRDPEDTADRIQMDVNSSTGVRNSITLTP
jgi:hypothetical protein